MPREPESRCTCRFNEETQTPECCDYCLHELNPFDESQERLEPPKEGE